MISVKENSTLKIIIIIKDMYLFQIFQCQSSTKNLRDLLPNPTHSKYATMLKFKERKIIKYIHDKNNC